MTDIGGSETPARKRYSGGRLMSGTGALGFGIKKHGMGRAIPTLKITYKDPSQLKPQARNPRTHTAKQIKQIVASIKEFGFISPILVDGTDRIQDTAGPTQQNSSA